MQHRLTFDNFSNLFSWRKACPICSRDLVCDFSPYLIFSDSDNLSTEKIVVSTLVSSVASDNNIIKCYNDKFLINLKENTIQTSNVDDVIFSIGIKLYCQGGDIDKEYYAEGSFVSDDNILAAPATVVKAQILDIEIFFETYKIYNVHLNENKPNGNLIKILNDFHTKKTSFSIAETNLDGTKGCWKEKRIDLVKDGYFDFSNSEKVYSRINTLFLLQ